MLHAGAGRVPVAQARASQHRRRDAVQHHYISSLCG